MMRYRLLGIFMVLAFAKAQHLKAQNLKIERESRIEYSAFPAEASPWVITLSKNCRNQKFYKETDGDKTSYELKCKCNGRLRSIEFSEDGKLEDVEINISKRKIKKEISNEIYDALDRIAKKNRIEKVQLQFQPISNEVSDLVKKIELHQVDHYELIVAFKEKRKIYRKELLFNNQGKLISSRDIKRIKYDFLLF